MARVLRQTRDPRWDTVLAVTPSRALGQVPDWDGTAQIPQVSGSLSPRLAAIFNRKGPTLVIGGDIPGITPAHIESAFKALGDPTRLRLLSLIAGSSGGEACICDLTEPVELSQPTVSHHMKVLVDAGLATREQRGRWAYYRVVADALGRAAAALRP